LNTEAKVGLFVVIAFVALFVLSIKVNTFSNIGKEGYEIFAVVENATGLEENAKVKISGVESGYIKKIILKDGKPILKLFIYNNIKIAKDSSVIIMQDSFLGGKFVEIKYGHSKEYLNADDIIEKNSRYASFDETADSIKKAANEFQKLMAKFNGIFDENTSQDLKQTIRNFKNMAASITQTSEEFKITAKTINAKLDDLLDEFKAMASSVKGAGNEFNTTAKIINAKLEAILDDFHAMTKSIKSTSDEFNTTAKIINTKLPVAFDKFTNIEDNITVMLEENRKPLNQTLKNAKGFFKKGEDAFSTIDDLVSKVGKAKLEVELKANKMVNDDYTKTTLGVAYRPNPSSYYIFELASGADYSKFDENKSIIEPGLHDEGKTFLSLMMGKRYDNYLLRAGIKENSGGIGADYISDYNVFRASLDIYDFNAVNDVRGDNAHATIEFRYRPIKHLNFYTGVDNFLNSDATNYFIGTGVSFVDDDLKYLMISTGSAISSGGM